MIYTLYGVAVPERHSFAPALGIYESIDINEE